MFAGLSNFLKTLPEFDRRAEDVRLDQAELPRFLRGYVKEDGSIKFDSRSEAACVAVLEKYVPGWRCVVGDTYEVPIGIDSRRCDFRIGDCFIEYHPIDLRHEFISSDSFREVMAVLKKNNRHQLERIIGALKKEFEAQYFRFRRAVIDERPEHRNHELLVCISPSDFYNKVIRRYALQLPTKQDFFRDWNRAL